jgi:glycosyltransferase involved in cell wall biosynthesis
LPILFLIVYNYIMKVAILSTADAVGGAAIAAYRLSEALIGTGAGATMVVKTKKTASDFVDNSAYASSFGRAVGFGHFAAERLSFLLHERDKSVRFMFSLANFGKNISKLASVRQADVINIHWINQGFLSLDGMAQLAKLGKPIFLTLHDMWAFTGGCHYADTCAGFERECGNCPLVKKPNANDISHKIWLRKKALFDSIDFQVITPSVWLKNIAKTSSLLRDKQIHCIPNTINTDVFYPLSAQERAALRQQHNIPAYKKLIFFFAMNLAHERKGFAQLLEAFAHWQRIDPDFHLHHALLVAGKADDDALKNIPCEVHYLGFLNGAQQVMSAYNLADVFVTPSLEDNLPNTIMESLACGTPVVAFQTGGIPEMVAHLQTGYIAAYRDAQALALGLQEVLRDDNQLNIMRQNARQKALSEYAYPTVAPQFIDLFGR